MQITIDVPESIAARAQACGLPLENYIQQVLEHDIASQQDQTPAASRWIRFGSQEHSPQEAADRILALQKGTRLGGLKIKDLIHEDHKY
jgi:hypothetical protein